jgi:hypothetical protein
MSFMPPLKKPNTKSKPPLGPLGKGLGVLQRKCDCGSGAGSGGECESCAQKKVVQRKAEAPAKPASPPSPVAQTLRSVGKPLDAGTKSFMESRFGHDFSQVRVHTDSQAAQSAKSVQAHAYTVGQDIAFGEGKYQPGTSQGQRLLAHELAHTVQQRGLQRSADNLSGLSNSEDSRYEAEADRTADRVVGMKASAHPAPLPVTRAGRPILSRSPYGTSKKKLPKGVSKDEENKPDPDEAAYKVSSLEVPAEKGKVNFHLFEEAAGRPDPYGLKTTREVEGGKVKSSDQEERDDPSRLRRKWLSQLDLKNNEDTDKIWRDAGGGKEFPYLRKDGKTEMSMQSDPCEVDHVIELQLGGRNNPENLQLLDKEDNGKSGRVLKQWTVEKTQSIIDAVWDKDDKKNLSKVTLRFESVKMKGSKATNNCLKYSEKMKTEAVKAAAKASSGDYVIRAVPDSTEEDGTKAGASKRIKKAVIPKPTDKKTDLKGTDAQNLIKYLSLDTLITGKNGDVIEATPTGKFKDVVTMDGETKIVLSVGPQPGGVLSLKDMSNPLVKKGKKKFKMRYFSPGTIDRMDLTPDWDWDWTGTLYPDPGTLLPKSIGLRQRGDSLSISSNLDPKEIKSPIPGMKITSGNLSVQILPTLSASGSLTFIIGSEAKPLADGKLDVGANTEGLTATGELAAHIPGVDEAKAKVNYQNGEWSAHIGVGTSQVKLPLVKKAQLGLDLDKNGVQPSGDVTLGLPNELGEVTVGFLKENEKYVFKGDGSIRIPVPGMKDQPVKVSARYDGEDFKATARGVGFSWKGLKGELTEITYHIKNGGEGKTSGSGKISIERNGITGEIQVKFSEAGKFSGKGEVSYPFKIRDNEVLAKGGVEIDENQKVHVSGAMSVEKPIKLFDRFGDTKNLFHVEKHIPLPGVSIGPVGIVAVVEGGVSIHYYFGPGQLEEVKITADVNPLEPDPDLKATFHCKLNIPAEAGFDGTVGGGIGVDAGLGSVTGTLTVTAGLNLHGSLGGPLDVQYAQKKLDVKAKPGLDAALDLGLSLDAHARAQAGIGRFSVGVEKDWNLGHRAVTLGQFGMHAPIEWSSDGGFKPPSMDQIEWKKPEINFNSVLKQLMEGAPAQEQKA